MTERPYITCRELIDFIADWREGTLAPTERFEFERHLARVLGGWPEPDWTYDESAWRTLGLADGATDADAAGESEPPSAGPEPGTDPPAAA